MAERGNFTNAKLLDRIFSRPGRYRRPVAVLLVLAIALLSYGIGFHAGARKNQPQALGINIGYHAPCLIDLSSGQVKELTVYTPNPNLPGELAAEKNQQSGSMDFSYFKNALIIRDTNKHLCRAQLSAPTGAYVLADLYDPENIRFYPVEPQSTYIIRDYEVSIYEDGDRGLTIEVQGLLFQ